MVNRLTRSFSYTIRKFSHDLIWAINYIPFFLNNLDLFDRFDRYDRDEWRDILRIGERRFGGGRFDFGGGSDFDLGI